MQAADLRSAYIENTRLHNAKLQNAVLSGCSPPTPRGRHGCTGTEQQLTSQSLERAVLANVRDNRSRFPCARLNRPPVRGILNAARKVVFSGTLKMAEWANTTIAAGHGRVLLEGPSRAGARPRFGGAGGLFTSQACFTQCPVRPRAVPGDSVQR